MNDKLQGERELPELVVTRNGKVCEDQAAALAEFKQACIDAAQDGDALTVLKQIHDVVMCIGAVTEAPESDPYTLREVKRMALRLNEQRLASDAEPVAEVVMQKLADFMPPKPALIWHNDDLPVGTKLYTEAASTAQAVEAAIRKAAHMVNEWAHVATMEGFETVRVVDLKDLANAILALIPTEAAQKEYFDIPDFLRNQDNLADEVAQRDAKDAERYRWLRDGNDTKNSEATHIATKCYGLEWDAAIDAAIASENREE